MDVRAKFRKELIDGYDGPIEPVFHINCLVRLPTLPSPSFLRHPHFVARWGGSSSRARQPKFQLD